MSAKFFNTSEIANNLNVSNDRILRAAKNLNLNPCGKITNKPSSHKPGKVWKAKQYRIIKKHFTKLAFA